VAGDEAGRIRRGGGRGGGGRVEGEVASPGKGLCCVFSSFFCSFFFSFFSFFSSFFCSFDLLFFILSFFLVVVPGAVVVWLFIGSSVLVERRRGRSLGRGQGRRRRRRRCPLAS